MKLTLQDIEFGKLDSKNEYRDEKDFFRKSFFIPNDFPLDSFKEGKKQYIIGAKGTGKTALLNHLYDLDSDNSSFVLYKTDIDEDTRSEFFHMLDKFDLNSLSNEELIDLNFENIWQLFFHQKIVKEEPNSIKKDKYWNTYKKKVAEIDKNNIFDYLDNIIASLNLKTENVEAGLTSEIKQKQKGRLYNKLAVEIKDAFKNLNAIQGTSYTFLVDELEINKLNKKRFLRDISMVRDLIVVANKMNNLSKSIGNPIKWITAVRTEVTESVESVGKEINKITGDYGFWLSWDKNAGNLRKDPIIQVLIKKIMASEELKQIETPHDYLDIWDIYFPQTLRIYRNPIPTQDYIRRHTFLRPRDIVRLFNIIKINNPHATFITQNMFESARGDYSKETFAEIMEELSVKYSSSDLKAIKFMLSSQSEFTLDSFDLESKKRAQENPEVQHLLNNFSIEQILTDLYNTGIIGNVIRKENFSTRTRFSYRGQELINLREPFILHDSIRKTLT